MYLRIIASTLACATALVASAHPIPASTATASSVATMPLFLNGTELGGHHRNMSADAGHLMNVPAAKPCLSTCKDNHTHVMCPEAHNRSEHCSSMHPLKPVHLNMTMPCHSSCKHNHTHSLCSKVHKTGEHCDCMHGVNSPLHFNMTAPCHSNCTKPHEHQPCTKLHSANETRSCMHGVSSGFGHMNMSMSHGNMSMPFCHKNCTLHHSHRNCTQHLQKSKGNCTLMHSNHGYSKRTNVSFQQPHVKHPVALAIGIASVALVIVILLSLGVYIVKRRARKARTTAKGKGRGDVEMAGLPVNVERKTWGTLPDGSRGWVLPPVQVPMAAHVP